LKSVINQKIASISSRTPSSKTADHQTTATVLATKEKLIPQASRRFDRRQHSKKSWLALALALGTSSLTLSSFVHSALVESAPTQPAIADSAAAMKRLPISALAKSSSKLEQKVQTDDGFGYPLSHQAPLTSPFGWRVHPISRQRRLHSGVDFEAPHGAPIVAAISGQVVVAGWHGGHGKTVVIERQGKLQTLYAHMSKMTVKQGQTVKQGELIGFVGSTGRSTGAHLHFETLIPGSGKDNWVAVDPSQDIQYALNNLQNSTQISQSQTSNRFN
jgi:murein DD-endopeptidase MepM/ murein hydrolase activator NlpD